MILSPCPDGVQLYPISYASRLYTRRARALTYGAYDAEPRRFAPSYNAFSEKQLIR